MATRTGLSNSAPEKTSASVSEVLRILLATCKKSTPKQMIGSINDFMDKVAVRYKCTPVYDIYPKYNKFGFSGRCVLYIKDVGIYRLIQGLTVEGEKITILIENPKLDEKEAEFEAEICRRSVLWKKAEPCPWDVVKYKIPYQPKPSEYSDSLLHNISWGDIAEIEDNLDQKYGPEFIITKKYVITPPSISFTKEQRNKEKDLPKEKMIDFGPFFLDTSKLKDKTQNALFAQRLPQGVDEYTIKEWIKPLCDHSFKVEMDMRAGNNLCARVFFKEKCADSHRVQYMYLNRNVPFNGKECRITFTYYNPNCDPAYRDRMQKQMEMKAKRKTQGQFSGYGNQYSGYNNRNQSQRQPQRQSQRQTQRPPQNQQSGYNNRNQSQRQPQTQYRGKSPRYNSNQSNNRGGLRNNNTQPNMRAPSRSASPSFNTKSNPWSSTLVNLEDTMK